jgi:hypothetical protein
MRVCGADIVAGVGVHTILRARMSACMSARMSVCTRTCTSACVHACVCARTCACMCVCVCARVYARGARKLKTAFGPGIGLPLLALRAGAQNPRAGKAGRSHSHHTKPTLLRATTGGAGGGCPVRSHANPWAHPWAHTAPSAGRSAGPTFVTGAGAVFCFRSSTGASRIARSPRTTGVHPASTRMQISAITRRRQRIRGLPSASPTPAASAHSRATLSSAAPARRQPGPYSSSPLSYVVHVTQPPVSFKV